MAKKIEIVMDGYIDVLEKNKRTNHTSAVSSNDKCKC